MQENPYVDRALRALFVACAVGLAWGIRGDFGGTTGAMYPGVMLALAFAYGSGQESVARRMPVLAILGGLLIGMGGAMSYGVLHGYAKADTPINYSYGFFTLLLQGGCWGLFGGGAIGLAMDDRRPGFAEGIGLAIAVVVVGVGLEKFVGKVLDFYVDSRGNSIIPFIGGGLVFVSWMAVRGYVYGLRGAFFGFLAFGIGMSFGRLLANASYHLGVEINTWNIMEISCGFIGGLIYTWGMIGLPDRAEDPPERASPWAMMGIFYAALGVPLIHLVLVGDAAEARAEWAASLAEFGVANAESLAAQVHSGLTITAFSGVVIAGLWYWWHNGSTCSGRGSRRWACRF
jgi:hypothetical protein